MVPTLNNGMKRWIILLWSLIGLSAVFGDVTFSGLDLAEPGTLLFRADADSPVYGSYGTLFSADLEKRKMSQLTFFPEGVMYLRETGQLQIQNRFGVFRTDSGLSAMAPVATFPSFVTGREIQDGKIVSVTASPDGKYLTYQKPVSAGYADLMLFDLRNGVEVLITKGVKLSYSDPGALWSQDSRFFVYARGGNLYYYSVAQYQERRVLSEDFRKLGKGRIANLQWAPDGRLYFLSGSLVYQIMSAEFFTRSLYSDLLQIGRIVGKIPFEFDPNFDRFWISPDGTKILLDKGGRNVFLYFLAEDDFSSAGTETSLPYLYLPRNTGVLDVLWTKTDTITVLTGSIRNKADSTGVFRLSLAKAIGNLDFQRTQDLGITRIVLSPDEKRVALLTLSSVIVRDTGTWAETARVSHPNPLHCVWKDNDTLIVSGKSYTEQINLASGSQRILCLSQPGAYGFLSGSGETGVRTGFGEFVFLNGNWEKKAGISFNPPSVAGSKFRVYLEKTSAVSYSNMVMVRQAQGYGTNPLFPLPAKKYEAFPSGEEEVDLTLFSHGSRIRRREVALVFNAIDSVEGLTQVLNTLAEYDLRVTFFICGEFIRRHPEAVREIAEAGHEVGSLFYVYFDMTDARYRVDKDFVKKGLARNEDDYFLITGKELSLLWHAPYYVVNTDIVEASREMNYTYVSKDVDPLDWVTSTDRAVSTGMYASAADIVLRILAQKKPGSIIPIRIGQPTDGQREDYLFTQLDLLLNALITSGYSVVTVSTLMEHAE